LVHNHRRCDHARIDKLRADKQAHIPRRIQMKISNSVRFLTLAAVSMLLATACTSTRTQKSAGETIDDGVISTEVNAALVGDSLTHAHNIDVEVFKGRVQLNGFVGSNAERNQAIALSRKVNGVHTVDNNLLLRGEKRTAGESTDDAALTGKVKSALTADERTKAHEINIETNHSVVLLAGFVGNATSRNAAGDIARSITGVKKVDNQIAIK
jgi:hyperosmotically inducible periplasmic protein